MPADIFMTYTRPSTDVAWPPKNEARRAYMNEHYVNTGKLLVNETIDSPNGLQQVVQRQFATKEDWDEFKNDPVLQPYKDSSHAYMQANGITMQFESSYY